MKGYPAKRLILSLLFVGGILIIAWILRSAFPKNSGILNLFVPLLLLDALLWTGTRKRIARFSGAWRVILFVLYWMPLGLVITGVICGFFSSFYYWPIFIKTYLVSFVFIAYLSKCLPILAMGIRFVLLAFIGVFRRRNPGKTVPANASHPGIPPKPMLRGLIPAGWIAGGIIFTTLMSGMIFFEHHTLVRQETIVLPDLPPSFDGLTIAQISDLHLGSWNNRNQLRQLVGEINDLHPDMIFFTGDLCNYDTQEAFPFQDVLSKLKAPDGIYAVLGNHDYGAYRTWPSKEAERENMLELERFYAEMGWKLLRNEHVILKRHPESKVDSLSLQPPPRLDSAEVIPTSIAIIGVENWGASRRFQRLADLPKALSGTEKVPVKLLLSHDPTHWDSIVSKQYPEIDITFSGHTHGGQAGIECQDFQWSLVQYIYPHWAGLYRKPIPSDPDRTSALSDSESFTKEEVSQQAFQYLYVNRGAGTIGYAGRIGIWAEITLITLQNGESPAKTHP